MSRIYRFIVSKSGLVQNQNYLLLLALLSCALLMNFHDLIFRRPLLAGFVFVMVFFSWRDLRFWWAPMAAITANFMFYGLKFPRLANHLNLELFISACILAVFIRKILVPKFSIPPQLLSCIFRVTLVTIYFYTGFHKLNSDFFNPCTSCVNRINEQLIENFTGIKTQLSDTASAFFQYATIFVEMILPFGLFWHRSRTLISASLLFFHFYLGFAVFADFESFAIFMLVGSTLDFRKALPGKVLHGLKFYLFFALLAIFAKPFVSQFVHDSNQVNFIHGILFNLGVLAFVIPYFTNSTSAASRLGLRYVPYPAAIILLISVWSMKGYFGLGNSANLTMFSNIITEKSRSNHLLIDTKKTKITTLEEDSVLILRLHDTLKKFGFENHRLPMSEFRYQAHLLGKRFHKIPIHCTFVYKNDTIVVPDLLNSGYSQTKWWYHYVNFRKIPPKDARECLW